MSAHDDGVSRETKEKLSLYAELLIKWNRKINLISDETIQHLWPRHIEDGLQLIKLIPSASTRIMDMGSGAGLPGLVIATTLPHLSVTLVERDQRKCSFLREVVRSLELTNVSVKNISIESLKEEPFDLITARALASLKQLCVFAFPHLGKDAICLFPKGKNFAMEITEAESDWSFDYRITPSKTQEQSAIISLSKLKPKS